MPSATCPPRPLAVHGVHPRFSGTFSLVRPKTHCVRQPISRGGRPYPRGPAETRLEYNLRAHPGGTIRYLATGRRDSMSFGQLGIMHNLAASIRIANWAYSQTETANGLTWLKADDLVPLAQEWRQELRRLTLRCR